jgi:phosphomevalonate kinase
MTLSVPGNLLLLGEYAATEPGGLGLAMALKRRVVVATEPGARLRVIGGDAGESYPPAADGRSSLVSSVVQACRRWLRKNGAGGKTLTGVVSIDSSSLYDASETKGGYGSSAAVAVGLTAAILRLGGVPQADARKAIFSVALEAHRRFQGGKGSGYDVAVSLGGGTILFEGGPTPRWHPCRLSWLLPLFLFRGMRPVATTDAIARYESWKRADPRGAKHFLEESNRNVRAFVSSTSWREGAAHFERCKELGISLGERIGVTAVISPPQEVSSHFYKAVGAGNEIGVLRCAAPAGGLWDQMGMEEPGLTW